MNWSLYLARYQKERGGAYFGSDRAQYDCQLVLTEGECAPILVSVDRDPAGKYTACNIFARTCVQLNGEYTLKIGDASAVMGGVKGLVGMVGGRNDYGSPEVTRNRAIATNNKPFTKQVLGDLELRNVLLKRKRDYVAVRPTPQGDGWHMVEVGDINFEGTMLGTSPWVNDVMVRAEDLLYMEPEDKALIEQAAQAHFNTQMDEFLELLRAAARAVTTWRM